LKLTAFLLAIGAGLAFAASASSATVDPWAKLRRPLHIPHLAAAARCPVTGASSVSADFGPAQGPGPVYAIGGGPLRFIYPALPTQVWYPSQWGGNKVLFVGSPTYEGPVLIRGRQLDGTHEVRFGGQHVPALELRLTQAGATSPTWTGREWPSYTRLRSAGCYGWQIDGMTFSIVIVFKAVVTRP
jgi:hypothetical protein